MLLSSLMRQDIALCASRNEPMITTRIYPCLWSKKIIIVCIALVREFVRRSRLWESWWFAMVTTKHACIRWWYFLWRYSKRLTYLFVTRENGCGRPKDKSTYEVAQSWCVQLWGWWSRSKVFSLAHIWRMSLWRCSDILIFLAIGRNNAAVQGTTYLVRVVVVVRLSLAFIGRDKIGANLNGKLVLPVLKAVISPSFHWWGRRIQNIW